MRPIHCFISATIACAASAAGAADIYQPASLKDGPVYPVVAWTGFYAGVNGGGAWSDPVTANKIFDVTNATGALNLKDVNGLTPAGGFGGGQIGYNWQGIFGPQVVFGIEADLQGGDISDSSRSSVSGNGFAMPAPGSTFRSTYDLNYFGTVRGRLGYAFDQTLIYATGGFAYGGVDYKGVATRNKTPFDTLYDVRRDDVDTGYAVGGGVEFRVSPNWSIKAEYQYIDLGEDRLTAGAGEKPGVNTATIKVENEFHTFRVGLNYKIGPDYEPLK
jgi:outer membrane immunogenic protein